MKKSDFNELLASVKEAGRIKRGRQSKSRQFAFPPLDIKRVRRKLNVSQAVFSHMIGVSVDTLQNWEQGRREPGGPARALLAVAARNPQAVLEALCSGGSYSSDAQRGNRREHEVADCVAETSATYGRKAPRRI